MSALDRVREICLAFPDVEERLSHGEPTWFHKGKRVFCMFTDHHHNDRVAVWIPAPPGAQEALVQSEPERYFRPPYVGPKGWVGIYIDGELDWTEVHALIEEAWGLVAPKAKGRQNLPKRVNPYTDQTRFLPP